MKKILLCVSHALDVRSRLRRLLAKAGVDHEQRKARREALRSYRQMVYLDDLTDAEFVLFTDDVAGQLENSYPVYVEFVPDAGRGRHGRHGRRIDHRRRTRRRRPQHAPHLSVQRARRARCASGGSGHSQQQAFYKCFAGKVNAAYATTEQFFNAILADTTDLSQIRQMESQCANDLFSWVVTEVDITETIPAAPAAAPAQKK